MSHSLFRVIRHTAPCQHIRDRPGATEPDLSTNLRLAVKQYVPKENTPQMAGGVTLIGTHGNGLPIELYEPLWDDLYEQMKARGRRIRSIWMADAAHQSESGVLNEHILGDDRSYLPYGFAVDSDVRLSKLREMPQPIIGIGHSMGGMQLANLALFHPSLFQALVLIDPVIRTGSEGKSYAFVSAYRDEVWPTRKDAIKQLKTPFCKWDPRVLEKYAAYGLRDLPTELYPDPKIFGERPVTLTTTKAQELFTYIRPKYQDGKTGQDQDQWQREIHPEEIEEDFPFYRPEPSHVFRRLPELKPSVLYVFAKFSIISNATARQEKMKMTGTGVGGSGGRVQEVTLPGGHLVPFEQVIECATACAAFCDTELSIWEVERQKFRQRWDAKTRGEKIVVDDRWMEHTMRSASEKSSEKPKL
ncbi:hypothetical protein FE257_004802 [Aspergillus nanangensis]|uniref:AB hydrolase-1 domain-containing protein n=1 Tax=Aspergillus nanangensis TaxID=2582783 RepID=A0AAD4GX67_ASPNN|nr:hypothetical protein FE257_004802 [Aspergillus nanangensis]